MQVSTVIGVEVRADTGPVDKLNAHLGELGKTAVNTSGHLKGVHNELGLGASKFDLHRKALESNVSATLAMARSLGPLTETSIRGAEGIERFATRLAIFTERTRASQQAQAALSEAYSSGAIRAATLSAAHDKLKQSQDAAAEATRRSGVVAEAEQKLQQRRGEITAAINAEQRAMAALRVEAEAVSKIPLAQIASTIQGEKRAVGAQITAQGGALPTGYDQVTPTEVFTRAKLLQAAADEKLAVAEARIIALQSESAEGATVAARATALRTRATLEGAIAQKQLAADSELVATAQAGVGKSMLGLVAVGAAVVAGLVAIVAAYEGVKHAIEFVSEAIKAAAQEQSEAFTFKSLIGNAQVAKEKFEELRDFWKESGVLDFKDLAKGAQNLTLMGIGTDDLIPKLKSFSEIAVATGSNVDSVAQSYQRVREAIIHGTDIPTKGLSAPMLAVLKLLEDTTGKTEDQLHSLFRSHKLYIEDVDKAIADGTAITGRYGTAIIEKAATWDGAIERIKTTWEAAKESFGTPLLDTLTPLLTKVSGLLASLEPQFAKAGGFMSEVIQKWIDAAEQGKLKETISGQWDAALQIVGGYIDSHLAEWQAKIVTWAGQLPPIILKVSFAFIGGAVTALADSLKSDPGLKAAFGLLDKGRQGLLAGAEGADPTAGVLPSHTPGYVPHTPSGPVDYFGAPVIPGSQFPGLIVPNQPNASREAQTGNSPTVYEGDRAKKPKSGSAGGAGEYDKIKSDLEIINKMWEDMAIVESKAGTQIEKNSRINDIFAKTLKAVDDPKQLERYIAALEKEHVVNARILIQKAQQLKLEKQIDDAIKAGTASVSTSFVRGVQKATEAWGNLDQQVEKAAGDITNALANDISTGLSDILDGTKSISEGFKDMAISILKSIEQIIVKMLVQLAIQELLQAAGYGGGTSFGGGGGGGTSFGGGGGGAAGGYHGGGLVGGTPTFTRAVSLEAWQGASRYHGGGILPGERPIIAKDGEGIFTQEQMARLAPVGKGEGNTSVQSTITVHINGGEDGKATTKASSDGIDHKAAISFAKQVEAIANATILKQSRQRGPLAQRN